MLNPVYNYDDYKVFFNELIRSKKNNGRGLYSKIAKYLGVSNVLVSQVLNGDRNFVRDKVFNLCLFFELSELETDYVLSLYEANVAVSGKHRDFLMGRLKKLKAEIMENQLDQKEVVAKEHQKIYYSSWLYSATRLSLHKDEVKTARDISNFLGYPLATIQPILDFLVEAGLVQRVMGDQFVVTDKYIHLSNNDEHAMNHHMNLKKLEISHIIDGVQEDEICYSSMVVTSKKVIQEQMNRMKQAIKEAGREFSKSESEDLILFNMSLLNMANQSKKSHQQA